MSWQPALAEVVATARATHAAVVGITVSPSTATATTTAVLNSLHAALAPAAVVWLGGGGSALLTGLHPDIVVINDLTTLEEQLDRLDGAAALYAAARRGRERVGRRRS